MSVCEHKRIGPRDIICMVCYDCEEIMEGVDTAETDAVRVERDVLRAALESLQRGACRCADSVHPGMVGIDREAYAKAMKGIDFAAKRR